MSKEVAEILVQSLPISTKLNKLESVMLQQDQADCPVIHHFGPGVYLREIQVNAGVFAIGHEQIYPQFNLFIKGEVEIYNSDGSRSVLRAPLSFLGNPGRKTGLVLEDMVWINVFQNPENCTDVRLLEEFLFKKSNGFLNFEKSALVDELVEIDKQDFLEAISELGYSELEVAVQSQAETDLIPLPFGSYKFQIGESLRHGLGVFATANIAENEVIGPMRINLKRTPLGRYCNHSKSPNSRVIFDNTGKNASLVAIKSIPGCRGGLLGEEVTVDYRVVVQDSLRFTKV